MRRLIYLTQAQVDLSHILRYITRQSGHLDIGVGFVERIKTKCADVARLKATLGRPRDDLDSGLRSLPYKDYIILFRYAGDTVEIVTVISSRRDIDALFDED